MRGLLCNLSSERQERRRVTYSAQQCFDRAGECDWMASQAKDSRAQAAFVECARQWQELVRQKEELEWKPARLPRSNQTGGTATDT